MRRLLFWLAVSAFAQDPLEPLLGNWRLNLDKSRMPGPPLASGSMKTERVSPKTIRSEMTTVAKSGETQLRAVTRICDGKEHASEGGAPMTYTCTPDSVIFKRNGKVISETKTIFSADKRVQTVTVTRQNPDGTSAKLVSVYEKF